MAINSTNSDIENTKAQMRKGILEFCILLIISQGEVYSAAKDSEAGSLEKDNVVRNSTKKNKNDDLRCWVYPSDILKELKEFDLIVVEGTLYPLLSRLKDGGLLEYKWVESKAGPPRKYYKLTDAGKNTLRQLEKSWKDLSTSIDSLIKKHG